MRCLPVPGGQAVIAPGKARRGCSTFSSEELEKTFFYPGPQDVSKAPGKRAQGAWEQAKEVCIECPFFLACREEHKGEEFGVWGGTDQYERYRERYRMSRRRQKGSDEFVAAEAARIYAMHAGHRGLDAQAVAYRTGYSMTSVRMLMERHQALLDGSFEERAAARELVGWTDRPKFPEAHPTKADAWVWYFGRAYVGHYVAQTPDGAYLLMKVKPSKAQTIKWLARSHVDMRTAVTPVVREWAGRPDSGVQAQSADDQCAGIEAADAA